MEGRGSEGELHRQITWELELEGRVGFHQAAMWEEGHLGRRNNLIEGTMARTMVQGVGQV